jgi:hypothetical protein
MLKEIAKSIKDVPKAKKFRNLGLKDKVYI